MVVTQLESNWITKLLDKFFRDKCSYTRSGKVKRGPGFLCSVYILLILIFLVVNIILTEKYMKQLGFSRKYIVFQNIIDIAVAMFSMVFMYHMCYRCNGFIGFILLIFINMFISFVRSILFQKYSVAMSVLMVTELNK